MKKYTLIALFIACSSSLFAQGINFEHWEKTSWKEALAKAKTAKKLLYVDVYTDWCGPCKKMAADYFPTREAGATYNSQFVSYKLDAEKGDGPELAKKYAVRGYPTNLFIDPSNEEIVFQTVGMPATLDDFLNNAINASLENRDPMSLEQYTEKYKTDKSKAFVASYVEKLTRLDEDNTEVLDFYTAKYLGSPIELSTLSFILKHNKSVLSKSFQVLKNNRTALDDIISEQGNGQNFEDIVVSGAAGNILKAAQKKDDEMMTKILAVVTENLGWESALLPNYQLSNYYYQMTRNADKINSLGPKFANKVIDQELDFFYNENKKFADKQKFKIQMAAAKARLRGDERTKFLEEKLKDPEVENGGNHMYARELNRLAWGVFEKNRAAVTDATLLGQATRWAKKAVDLSKTSPELFTQVSDTYANLLFVGNKKADAISVMKEAVRVGEAASIKDIDDYKKSLQTMISGK